MSNTVKRWAGEIMTCKSNPTGAETPINIVEFSCIKEHMGNLFSNFSEGPNLRETLFADLDLNDVQSVVNLFKNPILVECSFYFKQTTKQK